MKDKVQILKVEKAKIEQALDNLPKNVDQFIAETAYNLTERLKEIDQAINWSTSTNYKTFFSP